MPTNPSPPTRAGNVEAFAAVGEAARSGSAPLSATAVARFLEINGGRVDAAMLTTGSTASGKTAGPGAFAGIAGAIGVGK